MPKQVNEELRRRMSEEMTRRWQTPEWRDSVMRSMVQRWNSVGFRQRQIRSIIDGRRDLPLAKQPGGEPCGARGVVEAIEETVECVRRDEHAYHCAVIGSVDDWTLRIVGWDEK